MLFKNKQPSVFSTDPSDPVPREQCWAVTRCISVTNATYFLLLFDPCDLKMRSKFNYLSALCVRGNTRK